MVKAKFMDSEKVKYGLEKLLQGIYQFHTDSLYQQFQYIEETSC